MPIYTYRCDHCGIIERLEAIDSMPILICSACNCGVTKIISITNFSFATDSPNHPDKVQKKNEERKMYLKKGTLPEWQDEHKKKFMRDKYGVGGHFGDGTGAPDSTRVKRASRKKQD